MKQILSTNQDFRPHHFASDALEQHAKESGFENLFLEAESLAGRPQDLVQRASVYHHLYKDSYGNFVFPLLAAHGALWGSIHFKRGELISNFACLGKTKLEREKRLSQIQQLAWEFKDINRRVCLATYYYYHLAATYPDEALLSKHMPQLLATQLLECHNARKKRMFLSEEKRRRLFSAFFNWEQDHIVGPAVEHALRKFDWKIMKPLVLKPPVGFRYFKSFTWLLFKDFSNKQERIEKGLEAYDKAANVGFDKVERSLSKYKIMPDEFIKDSNRFFAQVKQLAI